MIYHKNAYQVIGMKAGEEMFIAVLKFYWALH